MKLRFTLGNDEKTELEINRNPITGSFTYSENGKLFVLKSLADPDTHIAFRTKNDPFEYQFDVGNEEKHSIRILHTIPLLLGGFRKQKYQVYINDTLTEEYYGY